MSEQSDELDLYIEEQSRDPEFAAAYADAQARAKLLASCIQKRKSASLSQAAIAQAMGTTQSAVSDLEAGATDPRISTLQRYARAVGVRLELTIERESAFI